ncbi:MAG: histidine phosphatase family protein [Acetobacteraceae bacterium]|nr:histidine phosphatase family protein [Acetobacteraceae bacterium]
MQQRWPDRLWIVRHGESAGNVARHSANAARRARIELAQRDVDVPLSELGQDQSDAVGRWFADMPAERRPEVLIVSPYLRARQTAARIQAQGGLAPDPTGPIADERLREKEFGVLDRLTRYGIQQEYPEQAEFRRLLGKFYHRPPGGESWCDVIFRLRSALDTISLHYGGRRLLIVAHQVVVLCLRYLLEEMDEATILAIDAEGDIANCGVTEYAFDPARGPSGGLVLCRYNFTAPIWREGTPVTVEPPHMSAR